MADEDEFGSFSLSAVQSSRAAIHGGRSAAARGAVLAVSRGTPVNTKALVAGVGRHTGVVIDNHVKKGASGMDDILDFFSDLVPRHADAGASTAGASGKRPQQQRPAAVTASHFAGAAAADKQTPAGTGRTATLLQEKAPVDDSGLVFRKKAQIHAAHASPAAPAQASPSRSRSPAKPTATRTSMLEATSPAGRSPLPAFSADLYRMSPSRLDEGGGGFGAAEDAPLAAQASDDDASGRPAKSQRKTPAPSRSRSSKSTAGAKRSRKQDRPVAEVTSDDNDENAEPHASRKPRQAATAKRPKKGTASSSASGVSQPSGSSSVSQEPTEMFLPVSAVSLTTATESVSQRPQRHRIAPLDFFRGERAEYERRESGMMLKGIVKVAPAAETIGSGGSRSHGSSRSVRRAAAFKKRAASLASSHAASDDVDEEDVIDDAEEEEAVVVANGAASAPYPEKTEAAVVVDRQGSTQLASVLWAPELEPQEAQQHSAPSEARQVNAFETDAFSAGTLAIPAGAQVQLAVSDSSNKTSRCLYVVRGTCLVKVHETELRAKQGAFITVPPYNGCTVTNLRRPPAASTEEADAAARRRSTAVVVVYAIRA